MDKSFHPTLFWACNYLSMLRIKLNHISKSGHWRLAKCPLKTNGCLANRQLTSLVKEATGVYLHLASSLNKFPWYTIFVDGRQHCSSCSIVSVNTLRLRQNCWHFVVDILKYIFLNEDVWILLKISLKYVPEVWINNIPTLVQILAWRRPGDKPLYGLVMVCLTDTYMPHLASIKN